MICFFILMFEYTVVCKVEMKKLIQISYVGSNASLILRLEITSRLRHYIHQRLRKSLPVVKPNKEVSHELFLIIMSLQTVDTELEVMLQPSYGMVGLSLIYYTLFPSKHK